jgi:hypothetical protein
MHDNINWDLDCPFPQRVRTIAAALSFGVGLDELHTLCVESGKMSEEEFFFAVKGGELLLKDQGEHPKPKPIFRRADDTEPHLPDFAEED